MNELFVSQTKSIDDENRKRSKCYLNFSLNETFDVIRSKNKPLGSAKIFSRHSQLCVENVDIDELPKMFRSPSFLVLLAFCIVIHERISGQSVAYETMIIFGDSNSDTGNVYRMTGFQFPPLPFYQGRFSDGPVWAERVNLSRIENYAYGGATTDNDLIMSYAHETSIPVPGVRQQIGTFAKNINITRFNFSRTLFVVWAGGNNYLRRPNGSISAIVNSLSNAVNDLLTIGATQLLVFNQPPLQAIPYLQATSARLNISDLTNQYNRNLSSTIQTIQKNNPKKSLRIFDLNTLITQILRDSSSYGISNTVNPCWSASSNSSRPCANASSYLFFDEVHFTSRVHGLIAQNFSRFIATSSAIQQSFSIISSLLLSTLLLLVFPLT